MITEEFTPEQAAVVARFEAGQAAEESLRSRVAAAMHAVACEARCDRGPDEEHFLMADAALAVIRGEA